MIDGPRVDPDGYGQDRSADSWTPTLLIHEDLTPLPVVDQALPIIGLFARLVGRGPLARYRVAILRELATQPRARLSIRVIQDCVAWMDPLSVSRLVQDLRTAELLSYDSRTSVYQLTREARVVAAVCGALTTTGVDYSRIIKVLSATMRLAEAMNAPSQMAYEAFLNAIAVLELDYEELRGLLNDFSEEALLEAARMAGTHVQDMQTLLEEQQDMFARFQGDPLFLEHDQRAHDVIASVGRLADEVVTHLSRRADLRLRGTLRVDRQDLRKAIEETGVEELADLVRDSARSPVFLSAVNTVAAFTALDDYLGRIRERPLPPPPPSALSIRAPLTVGDNPVDRAVSALERLAASGSALLSDWVVDNGWDEALRRNVQAVEAWSRHGPSGDGTLRAVLDARTDLLRLDMFDVGWMSATWVRSPSAGAADDAD
ncbi:hypothetical protein ACTMTJ_26565 [Phytohabitans sp. LJ34]|uniref:hypothetical protein n=1 Tax=Phytohabitans sp. LJ34 TaxID=3452217 RepID=UPI003F8A8636